MGRNGLTLTRRSFGLLAAGVAAASRPVRAAGDSTIKVIPQSDLRILDPVVTTATITGNHANMIYDTLFAMNGAGEAKPQMVESWSSDQDRLVWHFTLRPGLTWHDGSAVTTADVLPSLRRWAARAVNGQLMMAYVESMTAQDARVFTIRFKKPYGPVLETLGDSGLPAFIMRESDASLDPYKPITTAVGSGPFRFEAGEFRPGSRVVYSRFAGYVPRDEPPDGMAGGKIAKVGRVEWISIPDPSTASAALIAGEADIYEQPLYDLLPVMERGGAIRIDVLDRLGRQAIIRPNHLFAPFDNVKARQALMLIADQSDYLAAMVTDPRYRVECHAPFICGSPSESKQGTAPYLKADPARAKKLFEEAGYDGGRSSSWIRWIIRRCMP